MLFVKDFEKTNNISNLETNNINKTQKELFSK